MGTLRQALRGGLPRERFSPPLHSRLQVSPLAVPAQRSCSLASNLKIVLSYSPMALESTSSVNPMSVPARSAPCVNTWSSINSAGVTSQSVQTPKALSSTGHCSSRATLRMIHTHCASVHHRLARRPFNAVFTVASWPPSKVGSFRWQYGTICETRSSHI